LLIFDFEVARNHRSAVRNKQSKISIVEIIVRNSVVQSSSFMFSLQSTDFLLLIALIFEADQQSQVRN